MKFMDILTTLVLISAILLAAFFILIFLNPNLALNPFPPPTLPAAIVLPTVTNTPRVLPPTWTATPAEALAQLPSSTPLFTPTAFELATFTPSPSPSATLTPTPIFTPTPTRGPYACSSFVKAPLDGSVLQPDSGFDGRWILRNTGEKYWDSESTYAEYQSGTQFQRSDDPVKFKRDVQVGASVEMVVDMQAPSGIGTHYATWALVYKDVTICTWTVTLRVAK